MSRFSSLGDGSQLSSQLSGGLSPLPIVTPNQAELRRQLRVAVVAASGGQDRSVHHVKSLGVRIDFSKAGDGALSANVHSASAEGNSRGKGQYINFVTTDPKASEFDRTLDHLVSVVQGHITIR